LMCLQRMTHILYSLGVSRKRMTDTLHPFNESW
jgi:hypothetical protein